MKKMKLAVLMLGLSLAVTACGNQASGNASGGAAAESAAETSAASETSEAAKEDGTKESEAAASGTEAAEASDEDTKTEEDKTEKDGTGDKADAEDGAAAQEDEEDPEKAAGTVGTYPIYKDMDGIIFGFLSGVGAWETMLEVEPDGSFSGEFYDANMGESGEGYKNGTIYCCTFTGKFSEPMKKDPDTYTAKVEELEFETEKDGSDQFIEDETLYIMTSPYGLSLNDEIEIYTPGKPVSDLTEGFMSWMVFKMPEDAKELPEIAIYNRTADTVFYPDQYAMNSAEAASSGANGTQTGEEATKAYNDLKNAYYNQAMPDYYRTPYVPSPSEAPAKPYQSVTMENLQGRWVNRYTEGGSEVVEVLSVNGDFGRIETWIDGEKRGVWNGEGTISIEDRSDRNVCPAFRINDDNGNNLCTIYIRWVNSNAFYDGGFLTEWKREGNAAPDQYLYDTVTLDNLQGVWYTESSEPDGLYQVVLTVDEDRAVIFETIDGKVSSTWNGGGTASVVMTDFTAGIAYPELLIKMEHGPSVGGTAGIYISNVEQDYFYDCGLKRWYSRVPKDFLLEDETGGFDNVTMLDNGGAEITGAYHFLVTPEEEIKRDETASKWTVEITNDEGMKEKLSVEVDPYSIYKPFANDIAWEEDVNFDGIPDVLLFQGTLGAQGVTYYECYLSDGKKLKKCKGFDEIPNPYTNPGSKQITGNIRDGALAYYELHYRISGDEAVETEAIRYEYDEEIGDYVVKPE